MKREFKVGLTYTIKKQPEKSFKFLGYRPIEGQTWLVLQEVDKNGKPIDPDLQRLAKEDEIF